MHRRLRLLIGAIAVAATALAGQGARAASGSCAPAAHAGGEWRLYGHDLSNSRTQPDEHSIGTAQVGSLTVGFVFNPASNGGSGSFNSTPTVADGCVFAATDQGDIFALDADHGSLVWAAHYPVAVTPLGGGIAGAVTVDDGMVFVAISEKGAPYVVALDEFTGAERWRSVVDDLPGSFVNATPVPYAGLIFEGFAGDEYAPAARGGYAILDERTGQRVAHAYTIGDTNYANGYYGGSVWGTGAVDTANGYLYVGSGNPGSNDKQDPRTDSLLKIDMDRARSTFGDVVASYHGTIEQYYPGLDNQPVCQANPNIQYGNAWSASCVQFDVDFGASPNLFKDPSGTLFVGDLQKSGVYHVARADTMTGAWTALAGTPCYACNASSPATDGGRSFAAATFPGQLVALDNATGSYGWAAPIADAVHYNSVSIANGVVYVTDLLGNLNAFDESSGLLLMKHSMSADLGQSAGGVSSSGVAIARNTLYVPAGSYLIAYR